MWKKVTRKFSDGLASVEAQLLKRAKSSWFSNSTLFVAQVPVIICQLFFISGFNATDEENEASLLNLRKRLWHLFRKKIDEEVADNNMFAKLRERYVMLF